MQHSPTSALLAPPSTRISICIHHHLLKIRGRLISQHVIEVVDELAFWLQVQLWINEMLLLAIYSLPVWVFLWMSLDSETAIFWSGLNAFIFCSSASASSLSLDWTITTILRGSLQSTKRYQLSHGLFLFCCCEASIEASTADMIYNWISTRLHT